MNFNIRMGIPEMEALWNDLQAKHRAGTNKKKEEQFYKKESITFFVGLT